MDWDYPVPATFIEEADAKTTRASKLDTALPRDLAFKSIARDDQRPLLVLRECLRCKGTEHALFSRRLNNEKTMLLANWFHCVKLPPDVLRKNHPFRNVFGHGKEIPHLFLSRYDGSKLQGFDGNQPQSAMWTAMTALIEEGYEKKPLPAIKVMLRFLSQFDMLDCRKEELQEFIELEKEKRGPKSSKLKALRKKLAKVETDMTKAMKMAKAVCDLKLRTEPLSKAEVKKVKK